MEIFNIDTKPVKKLTAREKQFCFNYVNGAESRNNATKSAELAGYTGKNNGVLRQIAYKLMTKVHIKQEINHLLTVNQEANEVLVKKIIEERSKIAFANLKDYIDPSTLIVRDLTDIDTSALKKINRKETRYPDGTTAIDTAIELGDKLRALEGLASYLGIDKQTHQLTGKDGEPIEIIFTCDDSKVPVEENQ